MEAKNERANLLAKLEVCIKEGEKHAPSEGSAEDWTWIYEISKDKYIAWATTAIALADEILPPQSPIRDCLSVLQKESLKSCNFLDVFGVLRGVKRYLAD